MRSSEYPKVRGSLTPVTWRSWNNNSYCLTSLCCLAGTQSHQLSFYVLLARRGGGLTSEVFFPMWPPSLHSSLVCPPLSLSSPPQPPPSSHPLQLVSAPYAASVHCSIELFYYEIPFGMMEAWWVVILSGDLKLHHFNINLSSHLRTFPIHYLSHCFSLHSSLSQ